MAKNRRAAEREAGGAKRVAGLGSLKAMLAVVVIAKMTVVAGWLLVGEPAQARDQRAPDAVRDQGHPALAPVSVELPPIPAPETHREARSLLEALAKRQAELEKRERELAAREDRLSTYEADLTEKIAHLEELQKSITRQSRAEDEADSEAASALAKVYAAMKPSEAAPLLDRLDEETVLRILGHMRAKQIGELLPLLDRDKAIVITRALATGS